MEDTETQDAGSYLGVRKAAVICTAAFFGWYALASIPFIPVAIKVIGYFVVGVLLSRFVHRRLVAWHPVNATITNIFSAKAWTLVLWPLAYPILLFRLGVIKAL